MIKGLLLLAGAMTLASQIKLSPNIECYNCNDTWYYGEDEKEISEDKVKSRIYDTQNDIKKNYLEMYKDVTDYKVEFDYVPARNLNQNFLNEYYKERTGVTINNSCSPVAATMFSYFYLQSMHPDDYFNAYDLFKEAVDIGIQMSWYDKNKGTSYGRAGDITLMMLRQRGIECSTWMNRKNIYQGVVDFTYSKNFGSIGKIQVFGIKGHVMIANGYLKVNFDYTKEHRIFWHTWETTEHFEQKFLIVCTGWNNAMVFDKSVESADRAYDYFPLDTYELYVTGIDFPEGNY